MVYVLAACVVFAGAAFADGSAFTPLNFNDTTFSNTTTISSQDLSTATEEAIGNGNIQNAIGQLENAQVDMRNELLNVKTKFADVDAQYTYVSYSMALASDDAEPYLFAITKYPSFLYAILFILCCLSRRRS